MQNPQPSLFTRSDTILGACEGLGEDFGVNAQYLRVGLAVMMFWSPVAAIGTYAVIAAVVLISRLMIPNAAGAGVAAAAPLPALAGRALLKGENDAQAVEFAAAA